MWRRNRTSRQRIERKNLKLSGKGSHKPVKDEDKYNIRAIERALLVLEVFNQERRTLSLDELTKATRLSKSTVFRILSTLQSQQYVLQDKHDGRYRLGSIFLDLASSALDSLRLGTITRPLLIELSNKVQGTVLLGTLREDHLVYLDKRETQGAVRLATHVGLRRDPPSFGMLGMTLMAYLEPSEEERLLRESPLIAYTHKSMTDPDLFRRRLREIRERGHALEFEEAIEGVLGIAAPVWDSTREVVAAVGAALPMTVKSDEQIAETISLVKACSREISSDLGYRG